MGVDVLGAAIRAVPLDACVEVELDVFFGCYFLRVPF
jgi:hypothetical protein